MVKVKCYLGHTAMIYETPLTASIRSSGHPPDETPFHRFVWGKNGGNMNDRRLYLQKFILENLLNNIMYTDSASFGSAINFMV